DHVRHLARLERAHLVGDAEGFRGIGGQPADGALGRDLDAHARRGAHDFRRLLVEALDAVFVVRMDDRTGTRLLDERGVLANAVVSFHLETPPVRPDGGANVVLGQEVGDLVGLRRVVERRDLVAELARDVDHDRHLVGAVAVVVHQDLALKHARERFELQVARRLFAFAVLVGLELLRIVRRGDPRLAVARDVGHAAAGRLPAAAVHPFRVLAAGHLQPVRRTGEFHALDGAARHVLDRDAATAEQVGGARQDLQRGNAARERGHESRVLRPHAVLGPDLGRVGRGDLVAVGVRLHGGGGIHAEVGVHVDEAGRDPEARGVHARRAAGLEVLPDRGDGAVAYQEVGIVEPVAGAREYGGAGEQHRLRGQRPVTAGIRLRSVLLLVPGPVAADEGEADQRYERESLHRLLRSVSSAHYTCSGADCRSAGGRRRAGRRLEDLSPVTGAGGVRRYAVRGGPGPRSAPEAKEVRDHGRRSAARGAARHRARAKSGSDQVAAAGDRPGLRQCQGAGRRGGAQAGTEECSPAVRRGADEPGCAPQGPAARRGPVRGLSVFLRRVTASLAGRRGIMAAGKRNGTGDTWRTKDRRATMPAPPTTPIPTATTPPPTRSSPTT